MNGIAPVVYAALLAGSVPLHGQEYLRWVKDLGDKERSEAAERAILAMGDKAIRPLSEQLQQWGPSMSKDRALALLRIIRLMGYRAESLGSTLKTCAEDWSDKILPEIVHTLASLEPYAADNEWHSLFHANISQEKDEKGRTMAGFARLTGRQQVRQRETFEELKNELAKDRFAARTVAAEMMGKLGNKDAVELLHKRLLDRDKKPKDWDQLKHNGFVVPMADDFALQAGLTLVKLAPSDPRSAIGYANVALHHPYASVRLEMIRQMAQLGPAAADAIPELMALAKSDDTKLATEALKLLGMAGPKAGEHLREIRRLAARDNGIAAKVANSLARRLVAMGVKEPDGAGQDDARLEALAKVIENLDDTAKEEERVELAANPAAWDLLKERFRKERLKTPDVIFDVLVRASWSRTGKERRDLRHCVAAQNGDTWRANMMSTSSGGNSLTKTAKLTYARLQVDPDQELDSLAKLLDDDAALVRLVAIHELTRRADEWAGGTVDHLNVGDRLVAAATSKHPTKMKIEISQNHTTTVRVKETESIQAAAAEALVDYVPGVDKAGPLIKAIRQGKNEELIVKAIGKWARDDARKELEAATKDDRKAVADAAKAALEKLGGQ